MGQPELEYEELQERVLALEQKLEFLFEHLHLEYEQYASDDTGEDPEVEEALRSGNLLEAIKVYRRLHDADLASAKDAVEEIKARLGL